MKLIERCKNIQTHFSQNLINHKFDINKDALPYEGQNNINIVTTFRVCFYVFHYKHNQNIINHKYDNNE